MTLKELLATGKYHTDKGTTHSYIDFYDPLCEAFRDRVVGARLLEIGIANLDGPAQATGGSIPLWVAYFGRTPELQPSVTALDIQEHLPVAGARIVQGDATSQEVRDANFAREKFDIIIDDASHKVADQTRTFLLYRDLLATGGIYVVEDVQSDEAVAMLKAVEPAFETIDLRSVKGRYDDVLMVWRKS